MKNEVTKMCIRSDLNLLFTTSRFIATILDLADSMPLARETLHQMSEALMFQAAEVYGRVVRDYPKSEYLPKEDENTGIQIVASE